MDPQLLGTVAAAGGAAALFVALAMRPVPVDPPGDRLEERRRESLRRKSSVVRRAEGLVFLTAGVIERSRLANLSRAGKSLAALGEDDWRPAEYLAAKALPVLPVAPLVGLLAASELGWAGVGVAVLAVVAAPALAARGLAKRAAVRVAAVRDGLPHSLDLMALVLEAGGGTPHDCLRLAARENPGTPLGAECRRLVGAVDAGTPPAAALADLTTRMGDPDVAEVALTFAAAETHGLPLRDGLRAVAVRLRTRQVQWQEKAAERAKVHITWPAMTVMLACLLIIVGPVILTYF